MLPFAKLFTFSVKLVPRKLSGKMAERKKKKIPSRALRWTREHLVLSKPVFIFFSRLNPSSLSRWLSLCHILKTSNNKA